VQHPPATALEPRELTAHLVFRLGSHPAATREVEPMARREAKTDGRKQEHCGERDRAGARHRERQQ
jgi:hypothetical protein